MATVVLNTSNDADDHNAHTRDLNIPFVIKIKVPKPLPKSTRTMLTSILHALVCPQSIYDRRVIKAIVA